MTRVDVAYQNLEWNDDLDCWVTYAPCGCCGGQEMYAAGTPEEAVSRCLADDPSDPEVRARYA